ncbi:MAG: amidohydrolase family protein, partial [Clostridia bacterium]|nr:amidohydrolase family protein [Clostridia bacterium]
REALTFLEDKVKNEGITQFVSFGWETYELAEQKRQGYNFANEIEEKAPGIPVVLLDNSAHNAVCNTTALRMAGLLTNPVVRGGEVGLDKDGNPSGFVGDQAIFYVLSKVITNPLTDEQYENACQYGMNKLLELGYTNALDALANMYDPTALYKTLKKMDDEKKLKINVAGCYNIKSFDADVYREKVDEVVDIVKKYSSSHFNPAYIKLFADGVVESGTGWVSEPYNYPVDGKEYGNVIWERPELNALITYANKNNVIVHTHSYGDEACNATIDAYITSNMINGKEYRNCLAHVRNIRTEDVKRAAINKIPIAENLIWHCDYNENNPDDKAVKDYIMANIGETRYYSGYPMKSLMDEGVIVSSSTDAPAAESVVGSIMNVLEVATTGLEPKSNSNAFATGELLTVKEGLKALTINGAWQLGLENERGSIKVGKYADFVILDKNVLNYSGAQLRTIGETKILYTYFEGESVYVNKSIVN